MVTLREELVNILEQSNFTSIEGDYNRYVEEFSPKYETYLGKIGLLLEGTLLKIPNIIKFYLAPENVTVAIRIPISNFRYRKSYYSSENYSLSHESGVPLIEIHPYNTYSNPSLYSFKHSQKLYDKKEELIEKMTAFENSFFVSKKNEQKEKFEEEFSKKMLQELDRSGIKYSVKSSKNNPRRKWALLSIDKTKEEQVHPDYLELYSKLMDTFYR